MHTSQLVPAGLGQETLAGSTCVVEQHALDELSSHEQNFVMHSCMQSMSAMQRLPQALSDSPGMQDLTHQRTLHMTHLTRVDAY